MLTSYSSMLISSGLMRSSLARATFIMLLHLRGEGRRRKGKQKEREEKGRESAVGMVNHTGEELATPGDETVHSGPGATTNRPHE